MTLGDLLRSRAQSRPDKIFLSFEDVEISYGLLDGLCASLALGLQGLGARKGDRVAVLLPNCPEMVQCFFGIPRLGCVMVPINVHLTAEEIARVISHSGSRILVAHEDFAEAAAGLLGRRAIDAAVIVGVSEPPGCVPYQGLLDARESLWGDPPNPDDPAAIIYTAASSLKPRGVVLSHRNYISNAGMVVRATQLGPDDRFLCILPLFNVYGQVVAMLAPLHAGGSMVLQRRFSPREFLPAFARHTPTALGAVPTIYAILSQLPDARRYDLSSLRLCICGSAPLPVRLLQLFEAKYRTTLLEGYGLSEGTCVSSVNPIDAPRKIGSVGLPVHGQEIIIADEGGAEIPDGRIGEILIRGPNVMLGYHNDIEATSQVIRNGWLHTGDLGYRDRDGFFFIVGRKRDLIIRGGQNIFPREVEEVLRLDGRVEKAAAIGIPDEIWGERVAAFVELKPGAEADAESIISLCREHLAEFKCPQQVLIMRDMPLNDDGGPNKRLLFERYLDAL